MKKLILTFVAIFSISACSFAQVYGSSYGVNSNSTYVQGYTKSNGTYVQGHYRSSQNSTHRDNYSTVGNSNPYTGKTGSRAQDYSGGHTITVAEDQYTPARVEVSITSIATATKPTCPNADNL